MGNLTVSSLEGRRSKKSAVPDLIPDLNVAGLRPRLKAGAALRSPRTHDRDPVHWL